MYVWDLWFGTRERIDRQDVSRAITSERSLIHAPSGHRIYIKAFSNEGIYEPCTLADSDQNTVPKFGKPTAPSKLGATQQPTKVTHYNLANPLCRLWHSCGMPSLPLNISNRKTMPQQKRFTIGDDLTG